MNGLLRMQDGKLVVTPHAGQLQAWDSKRRFIFIVAGTQSGKTSYLPVWLDREIRNKGEGDYLAVTATYDLLKMKFLPELQNYFVHMFKWGESKSERTIYKQYKPRMFTRIICRSADAEGGLESASAKGALFDECGQDGVKVSAWEALQRRLSLSQGRVLAGTTPYNFGWLKTQIYDRWRSGDEDLQVIQFKSTMNPSFPIAEYERAKRTLPSWKFEMFYNGEFSKPAGMIYEDFTEQHIIKPFDIPLSFPRFLGVDFGAVHTAKIWVAQDPQSGLYYLYRESLEGGRTTQEHVNSVKAYGENNLQGWGGSKSETQQRRDWLAAGLHLREPVVADVESGINRVIALLKERKLYVFSSCTGIIDEMGTYSRELDTNGQPTEKIKDKATFHRLDALRYVAAGLDINTKMPDHQPTQKSKFVTEDVTGWSRKF